VTASASPSTVKPSVTQEPIVTLPSLPNIPATKTNQPTDAKGPLKKMEELKLGDSKVF
jgi:hypothetical protein